MPDLRATDENPASNVGGALTVRAVQDGASVKTGGRVKLTANTTITVGSSGDFSTIQAAANCVGHGIDLGSYAVTIGVQDGSYPENVTLPDYVGGTNEIVGSGADVAKPVKIVGNPADLTAVKITGTAVTDGVDCMVRAYATRPWFIGDITFQPQAALGADAIEAGLGCNLAIGNVRFNAATNALADCLYAPTFCNVVFMRDADIEQAGAFRCFIEAYGGAKVQVWEHTTLEYTANASHSYAFVSAGDFAEIIMRRGLETITYNGFTVTGTRWDTFTGGAIYWSDNSDNLISLSSLPGNADGSATTGKMGWANNELKLGFGQLRAATIPTLPTGVAGKWAYISDGDASVAWGDSPGAGGGSTKYLIWHNGTGWTVVGK